MFGIWRRNGSSHQVIAEHSSGCSLKKHDRTGIESIHQVVPGWILTMMY